MAVRVRYAPSPTGHLHLGGARTALFNYLFAKQQKGRFILRIEDTDQARTIPGAAQELANTLRLCGMDYDEGPDKPGEYGPYIQSERQLQGVYVKPVEKLLDKGHAYRCFCSADRLQMIRNVKMKQGIAPIYDKLCMKLSDKEIQERLDDDQAFTVRMNVPHEKQIKVEDEVRGTIAFEGSLIDDQILVKSDGFPTYHLASVVDDHHMEISHVIRGDEWLSSMPKHQLLYEAFGWKLPKFYHLPLLTNIKGQKLSKRHGDVSVASFINKGYEPHALMNFVVLLGWSPGIDGAEFMPTMEQMIQMFDLNKVQKGSAVVDEARLKWLNTTFVRHLIENSLDEVLARTKPMFESNYGDAVRSDEYLKSILYVARERATFAKDLTENEVVGYFFKDPKFDSELAKANSVILDQIKEGLSKMNTAEFSNPEKLKILIESTAKENNLHPNKLMLTLRKLLTGGTPGPSVAEVISILGKETVFRRLGE
jgi:nondiscriminating glutamyl-tRNA synthetase